MLLETQNSRADLLALEERDLDKLCAEIRTFLVEGVAETGGHLASNLGVVELTVALHRVFDFERDRLVFDVGHQSYTHKILTGRRDAFGSLRKLNGLSGFPDPRESDTDAFIAGHASTAISTGLGLARARTLLGADYQVVSLVGDGALTGGLSYEGLSNVGPSGEPMIVVLNDNGMSITENVGGFAKYLTRLRLRPGYNRLKHAYRQVTDKLPGGRALYRVTHRAKNRVKNFLFGCSFFENLGFHYMGPVDGHNIKLLIRTLQWAKRLDEPVLVHVKTKKGKGYPPSEREPDEYHGVGSFSPAEGLNGHWKKSFSDVFGASLAALGKEEPRLVAITAAMQPGTGLVEFGDSFPDRFYDVGIAEGHAVTMAAGMAKDGLIPVFAVYSSFLQRAYDMLIHDVAISDLHVILAVDRAGLVGADGKTHQGVFDVGFLSQIPGITIYCPASFAELDDMLRRAVTVDKGPVAIRYPRGGEGIYRASNPDVPATILRAGEQVTLVSYGILINECLAAAEMLEQQGIRAEVIKLGTIKPLDMDTICESVGRTGHLLVVEDQVEAGGVGERILAGLAKAGAAPKSAALLNLGDEFIPHGEVPELLARYGLDAQAIVGRAMDLRS
ncbi:MAG: 1-deoxy-D-xylulose-5-phosphate synthase [Oscillospiraceae bacterium]|nr:1-deoxy-D-xylulose-5-phosphate synthase [Oscillospiraceae bacterium]